MLCGSHIIRLITAFALLWQMALPAIASSSSDEFSAANYLCNVTEREISPEAEAHYKAFFALIGQTPPAQDDGPAPDHCMMCFITGAATIPQPSIFRQGSVRRVIPQNYSPRRAAFPYEAQGPPLGMRAPPLFV